MTDLPLFIKSARMKCVFNIKGRLLFERGEVSGNKGASGMRGMRERDIRDVLDAGGKLPDGILRFVRDGCEKNKDGWKR